MITTVLFDLDGTLLPMDQEEFVAEYMKRLCMKAAPYGYDPKTLPAAVWKGTGSMVANDGSKANEDAFWDTFSAVVGKDARVDIPMFQSYYENEFNGVAEVCGTNPKAAQAVALCKELGFRIGLATNPLFPEIATRNRAKWNGIDVDDFEIYTTYEDSYHSKPNPAYFTEVADRMGVNPADCLMVGNDATEDLAAAKIGMKVFLVTDCLINTNDVDISAVPQGNFDDLMDYLRGLNA